ncbi:unnamed protein product [Prorocentrum cordatum]|uniref:Uncharacterized protein n=1 Tax=Prorocentrum cordatum TaxID=2364126 RepID=A0ABN9XJJ9_9DINO|nr:unnamed protein product [Polarella glacialis]
MAASRHVGQSADEWSAAAEEVPCSGQDEEGEPEALVTAASGTGKDDLLPGICERAVASPTPEKVHHARSSVTGPMSPQCRRPARRPTKTTTKTPTSASSGGETRGTGSSFSGWLSALSSLGRERRRTEAEVQAFLQAHGFSDVNHLKQASCWRTPRSHRPLHVAVSQGDAHIARLLILHGADPALPDAAGELPGAAGALRGRAAGGRPGCEEARRVVAEAAARARPAQRSGRPGGPAAGGTPRKWDIFFDSVGRDPLLHVPQQGFP